MADGLDALNPGGEQIKQGTLHPAQRVAVSARSSLMIEPAK